jgi:tetratricopeptide (TPR) repeat protein
LEGEVDQMKLRILILLTVAIVAVVATTIMACPYCEKNREYIEGVPVVRVPGIGTWHRKVTTNNAEAQAFFDQGLAFHYAFNSDEAIRAYTQAYRLDSNLAMAYWGIAVELGANYNIPMDSVQAVGALKAIQKAQSLASFASQKERDMIAALAIRYNGRLDPDQYDREVAYNKAMKGLTKKYQDDPDIAVLYAESIMNLNPWKLWTKDGKPVKGTKDLLHTLEVVMKRWPNNPGAHHFYVHAVEASPNPEKALESARVLDTLVPAAGHLVHMPAHTYIRVGDYAAAVEANVKAVSVDSTYIAGGGTGFYTLFYYPHNIHFCAVAAAMDGQFSKAMHYAARLEDYLEPSVRLDPMIEAVYPTRLQILTKYHRWDEILAMNPPDSALLVTNAVYQFARGFAFGATGSIAEAKNCLATLESIIGKFSDRAFLGAMNPARTVMTVATLSLKAKIAEADGDVDGAIKLLRTAVAGQDSFYYDEPEAWYISIRESLGGLLLRKGSYKEAEAVFRTELVRHKNSGRALFGLAESLREQNKVQEALQAETQYKQCWARADSPMSRNDL